jgi:hypothetical protein
MKLRVVLGCTSHLVAVLALIGIAAGAEAQAPKPASQQKPAAKKAPVARKTSPAAPVATAPTPEPPPPPPAPKPTAVKVRTRYTANAQVSENITYFSGARRRFEFPGLATITECDAHRTVQVNDRAKRYLVQTTAQAPAAAPTGSAGSPAKGGLITYTVTTIDTGERKEILGREARHITIVTVKQPSADACDKQPERITVDGWYVDLPDVAGSCPVVSGPAAPPSTPACTDRVETKQAGDAPGGFAVATTMTSVRGDAQDERKSGKGATGAETLVTSMEVVDLQTTAVEPSLFEIPGDYTEVKDLGELVGAGAASDLTAASMSDSLSDALLGSLADGTRTIAPKAPGVVRVGVAPPVDKSGRDQSAATMRAVLLASLNKVPYEAVPIVGDTAADLERDATTKQCDYVLTSDLTELRSSKPGKAGGLLKKMTGDMSPTTEVHDARVDYRLYAIDKGDKPLLSASAKASSGGGFGVGSALKVAAFAGQMYVGAMTGMAGMGGLGSFASLGLGMGGTGLTGMMMGPGMGAAMSMMAQAGMPNGMGGFPGFDENRAAAERTVTDAFSKAGSGVADELKKKPAGR